MTWRTLPLVELSLFLLIGAGWRAWLQRRRTGSSGVVLFRGGATETLRELGLVAANLLLAGEAVALVTGRLMPLPPPWPAVGVGLVVVGTGLMVKAQLDLGASWRIGIEEGARPGLVTSGWYSVCRNPIFLFMFVAYAGLAIQLPTWLSLVLFVGLCLGVRRHVLSEEAYLERTYGEAYRAYARRVGRFLPWLGRWPAPGTRPGTTLVRA